MSFEDDSPPCCQVSSWPEPRLCQTHSAVHTRRHYCHGATVSPCLFLVLLFLAFDFSFLVQVFHPRRVLTMEACCRYRFLSCVVLPCCDGWWGQSPRPDCVTSNTLPRLPASLSNPKVASLSADVGMFLDKIIHQSVSLAGVEVYWR